MIRRLLRRLRCRLGRHHWQLQEVAAGGVLTVVPRCDCGRVDVDRIRQAGWNRAARRRWSKQLGLRRSLR